MVCTENIECLGEFCACGNILLTALISPFTGVLKMFAEFNGVKITRDISVLQGSPISIPNVFNEDYIHVISFYNNGVLLNDTSYSITVVYCLNSENVIPLEHLNSIIIESVAGNTIADPRINGEVVTGLIIDDFSKNKGYTVSGSTITFTDQTTLVSGQIITIIFE